MMLDRYAPKRGLRCQWIQFAIAAVTAAGAAYATKTQHDAQREAQEYAAKEQSRAMRQAKKENEARLRFAAIDTEQKRAKLMTYIILGTIGVFAISFLKKK